MRQRRLKRLRQRLHFARIQKNGLRLVRWAEQGELAQQRRFSNAARPVNVQHANRRFFALQSRLKKRALHRAPDKNARGARLPNGRTNS